MYRQKSRSSGTALLLANVCVLVASLAVATAAALITFHPGKPDAAPVVTATSAIENDRYEALLLDAKTALERRDSDLQVLRAQIETGFVDIKDVSVRSTTKAYWLAEPNLMLGVNTLSGGGLLVSFGDRAEQINVGQRVDFDYDGNDCFLMLMASTYGDALFRFGCTPRQGTALAALSQNS